MLFDKDTIHKAFALACSSSSGTSLETIKYLAEKLDVDPNHPLPEHDDRPHRDLVVVERLSCFAQRGAHVGLIAVRFHECPT